MNDWIKRVTTDSTFPPPGTFNRTAKEIATIMVKPDVSPLGIHSGIKMVQYFINRAGYRLPLTRKLELMKAIKLMKRMRQPKWEHPPTHCKVCGGTLVKRFNVVRLKSTKQLIITCDSCVPVDDVSELTYYSF